VSLGRIEDGDEAIDTEWLELGEDHAEVKNMKEFSSPGVKRSAAELSRKSAEDPIAIGAFVDKMAFSVDR